MPTTEIAAPRLDWTVFQETVPEFAAGIASPSRALSKTPASNPELRELIKIRASQLNGCAFCIQYHLNDARKINVAPEKLDLLAAWREAGIYSPREAAALEWTERVTLLAQHPIEDEDYASVVEHFSPREATFLTVAISQINAWNRVAAPFRFSPPIPAHSS